MKFPGKSSITNEKNTGSTAVYKKNYIPKGATSKNKSQTTQTSMSKLLRPFNNTRMKQSIDQGTLHSKKTQRRSRRRTETNKMKILRKKFFSLVKKNTMENKSNESKFKQDIHLIKDQVSVKQIQKVLLQMSNHSGSKEENSCVTNNAITTTKKFCSDNHGALLTEFLQTVINKQISHNDGKKCCTLNNLNTNSSTQDEKCVQKNVKTLRNHFDKTEFIAYPLITTDTIPMAFISEDVMFQPKLYSFRLLSDTPVSKHQIMTKPPAFSILLDNFIAVIWGLMKQENIGINPLQWTYELLKIIKYKNGRTPEIVEKFIETIENKLIESYAEVHELKEKDEEKNNSFEAVEEHLERNLSLMSHYSNSRNKWVNEIALQKSYSLREIVKRGKNSICKPTEEDKLVIKSLIPTATLSSNHSHPKRCNIGNQPKIDDLRQKCQNLDDIKNLLYQKRKTHTMILQQELRTIKKIENCLVKVDDTFEPSMSYQSAQIVSESHEKLNK